MRTPALIGAGILAISGVLVLAAAGPFQPAEEGGGARPQPGQQPGQQPADMGAMLARGLKATEGCLGVELASTQGGKSVIMAWFEDAAAARRWYTNPVHMRMVGMVGAQPKEKALEHVPDNTPVLVIASLTMAGPEDQIQGSPIPISQIAIELYTPLPGGAFINGRLAPQTLEVEHMTDFTPAPSTPDPSR